MIWSWSILTLSFKVNPMIVFLSITGFTVLSFLCIAGTATNKIKLHVHCIHGYVTTWRSFCRLCDESTSHPSLPVVTLTTCFDAFFIISLNELLNKQSRRHWFEAPRHLNDATIVNLCTRWRSLAVSLPSDLLYWHGANNASNLLTYLHIDIF